MRFFFGRKFIGENKEDFFCLEITGLIFALCEFDGPMKCLISLYSAVGCLSTLPVSGLIKYSACFRYLSLLTCITSLYCLPSYILKHAAFKTHTLVVASHSLNASTLCTSGIDAAVRRQISQKQNGNGRQNFLKCIPSVAWMYGGALA